LRLIQWPRAALLIGRRACLRLSPAALCRSALLAGSVSPF
jgi:hypothetical protein